MSDFMCGLPKLSNTNNTILVPSGSLGRVSTVSAVARLVRLSGVADRYIGRYVSSRLLVLMYLTPSSLLPHVRITQKGLLNTNCDSSGRTNIAASLTFMGNLSPPIR